MQDAKTKPARQLRHWMLGAATGGCMSWCTYIQDRAATGMPNTSVRACAAACGRVMAPIDSALQAHGQGVTQLGTSCHSRSAEGARARNVH